MSQLDPLLKEIIFFFDPVAAALSNEDSLRGFLENFGYDLDAADAGSALQDINSETQLTSAFSGLGDGADAGAIAKTLFSALQGISKSSRVKSIIKDSEELSSEILDTLCVHYLSVRAPFAVAVLKAMGVITSREIKTTDSGGRDFDYTKVEFNWERLGDFVRDNGKWAADVYGWANNFDYEKAITNLIRVVQSTQLGLASKRELTASEIAAFLKNAGTKKVSEVALPFFQDTLQSVQADGTPVFSNEAGIKVVPFGDVNIPKKLGLAIAPYVKGSVATEQPLSERFTLKISAEGQATGGAYITMTPDGIAVAKGGAVDAGFEFGLTYANADGTAILLVGDPKKTRLETKSILCSAGGNLSGDFFIAGGFDGLSAAIDLGDDGFLGSIVPEPIEIEAGTIMIGWRTGRGIYFDGGTSLTVTIPLDVDLGPISLYELIVELDWATDLSTTVMITADAQLGPLYAFVENAGIVLTLVPAPSGDGVIGKYDIKFGFKPPTGYAVALEADPIEGGGYLSVDGTEYRGALALKFQAFSFAAFAILNTQLPGGRKGFSMAASIFGEFNIALGYGFFLTGVGGVIGINRTVDTDALRDVLYEGRMDNLLFPADPIPNAKTILDDMAAVLPAREGQYLFGPVARISWGQPNLVDVKLGVILEVGGEIRILILGGLACSLPTRDAGLVVLTLSFFGEIDFAAGTIDFDASLQGSRVLSWPISGDTAIRTGWAPRIQHVASFGGLHPRYPRPSNLPELRRMSINFGTNNPKITLSAYQAVTMNSLQFGARADLYAKGPKISLVGQVAAEGIAYFDALIYFNPFAFDVALGGGLSLLVDGDVVCGLGFKLRLTGPNTIKIDGKVWVTVCGIDVDFNIKHTWGKPQSLPTATVDGVAALRTAITASKVFEPVAPQGRSSGVTFRTATDVDTAIDPIGGVRFVQRAVPLGVKLQKIGEAKVSGPATLDLKVLDNGAEVAPTSAKLEFVRGHFFELTEAERLRTPAFESHKAGFEFAADDLAVRVADAVTAEYTYEVIEIPVEDDRNKPLSLLSHKPLQTAFATRFMAATHESWMRPKESYKARFAPADPVVIADHAFVRQEEVAGIGAAAKGSGISPIVALRKSRVAASTLSGAKLAGAGKVRVEANVAVADYVAAAQFRS